MRIEKSKHRKGKLFQWSLIVGFTVLIFGFANGLLPLYSAVTFLICFVSWTGVLLLWTLRLKKNWYLTAHRLLAFALPLVIMMAIAGAAPHRVWSVPLLIVALIIVCFLALRESPLVSSILLVTLLSVPMSMLGLAILIHAWEVQRSGAGWTELDKPTPDGWKPMLAIEAQQVGRGMVVGAVALVAVVALFARRALVRLRRLGRDNKDWRNVWREYA
ncbi:MAG: hypothetical protein ACREJD_10675 [Phycisphaerales bacterium]